MRLLASTTALIGPNLLAACGGSSNPPSASNTRAGPITLNGN
jgi:hypothetical protein